MSAVSIDPYSRSIFLPTFFGECQKTKLFTFSSMTLLDERDFNFCWIFNIFSTRVVTHCTQTQQHATSYNVIRSFANSLVRAMVQIFFVDVQKCTMRTCSFNSPRHNAISTKIIFGEIDTKLELNPLNFYFFKLLKWKV